jgi:sugar phosphate isomerase/epimerase
MENRIGVCSWSLQPRDAADLVQKVAAAGLSALQLALDPLRAGAWPRADTAAKLRDAGIALCSGMMTMQGEDYATLDSIRRTGGVRADEHWEANLAAAHENGSLARDLGFALVTFHAGFLPHDRQDALRATMIRRLRAIIDVFGSASVQVAFETGQEDVDTLCDVLEELDRPDVGVNFDPANMILYGTGDPVASLRTLAPRVAQIHIKDAVASETPGTWGTEVAVGEGQVDWPAFFDVLRETGLDCDLVIEREAGRSRVADVRKARDLVARLLASGDPEDR